MTFMEEVISKLGYDKQLVIKLWNFCIPVGEFSEDDKLRFIIASLPNTNVCSAGFVALQLRIGPEFVEGFEHSVQPEMIRQWYSTYVETADAVATTYAKRGGTLAFGEWRCMCALREALNEMARNGGDAVSAARDVESIQSAALTWLHRQEG